MKKLFKTIIIIVIIFVAIIISVALMVSIRMSGQVKSFDRSNIDLSQVADGVYNGRSETDLVKVEVRVTVADGTIQDVEILKHQCGKGLPANEIVKDMIRKNDIEVDAVSGATMSSEVIKDAVRNALRAGL
ncbi:MAG: FMN-binding protein [Lachnospiraceae bacterium]|nr:FMN-binding protein [Lachnospiraceae bacterium]